MGYFTFSFGILTKTIVLIFFILGIGAQKKSWHEEKFSHQVKDLSAEEFKYLALYQPKSPTFESLLDPILIPRVSGTENNAKVKQFIINHMNKLGWATETDDFTSSTPHGTKPFSNIISTHNPHITRRLVLACHYDSKYFREDNFVGATDSAVPCAQMLHLASTLHEQLKLSSKSQSQNVTLQFIFFDGEEAFVNWGPTDSLYGSRHLAEKWEKTPFPLGQSKTSELHRMDVMVLLDLLGVANPKFYSFFQETNHLYSKLFEAEQSLRRSRYWTGNSFGDPLFKAQFSYGGIEDDHIPFLHRGVDIVHVIPSPFPREWHQPSDNRNALDFPTIENLNRILRVFVARYLHLPHNSS